MNLKEMLSGKDIIKIKYKNEESFVLNELGTKSRIYFDIKLASLNSKILREISLCIGNLLNRKIYYERFKFDSNWLLGSIAIGGIPIATAFSLLWGNNQVIIRNCPHERGTITNIIGNCKDKNVLFIDDVAVTGNTIIKGINTIREVGGICNDCLVVVDRQEGAEKNCLDNGINLYSLLKKSDFGINLE